jgi:hypothetical protein
MVVLKTSSSSLGVHTVAILYVGFQLAFFFLTVVRAPSPPSLLLLDGGFCPYNPYTRQGFARCIQRCTSKYLRNICCHQARPPRTRACEAGAAP